MTPRRTPSEPTARAKSAAFAALARLAAPWAIVAALGGCMRMQTQQHTLEHRPQVVQPDADQGDRVAEVPEQDGSSR